MRRTAALLPLCVLLALPAALGAQRAGRVVPYAGVSVGTATLPTSFDGCGDDAYTAAELRAGVARGPVAVEARLSALADLSTEMCIFDPIVFPEGIHSTVHYPDRGDGSHLGGDVRVRLGGTRAMPLAVSAGTGWLRPVGVPYLVTGAGVRLGGRLRLAVDAERTWYRVRRLERTQEWKDNVPVRLISISRRGEWMDGFGVRAGVDLPFR